MIRTWAVVPSAGRDLLDDCVASLLGQVYHVVVVANHRHPLTLQARFNGLPVQVVAGGDEMNIQRWWNVGLDTAEKHARWLGDDSWNTLVVGDDIIAPPHLAGTLSAAMRATTAAAAYPDQFGGDRQILHTEPVAVDRRTRITGYTFMLRGEAGLRADESMVWWYGDDDLDWQARQAGGALLVPGCAVEHRAPGGYRKASPELQRQTDRDRETFKAKWGRTPHPDA